MRESNAFLVGLPGICSGHRRAEARRQVRPARVRDHVREPGGQPAEVRLAVMRCQRRPIAGNQMVSLHRFPLFLHFYSTRFPLSDLSCLYFRSNRLLTW